MSIFTADKKPTALDERVNSFDDDRDMSAPELGSPQVDFRESQIQKNEEPSFQMAPNPSLDGYALNGLSSPAIEMAPAPTLIFDATMQDEEEQSEEETEELEQADSERLQGLPGVPPEDDEEDQNEDETQAGQVIEPAQPVSAEEKLSDANLQTRPGVGGVEISSPGEPKMGGQLATEVQKTTASDSAQSDEKSPTPPKQDGDLTKVTTGNGKKEEAASKEIPLETSSSRAMIQSLTSRDAVSFVNSMQTASNAAAALQETEKKKLQESLPEIDQPTGLPTKAQKKAEELALKKDKAPDLEAKGTEKGKEVPTEHKQPEGPAPAENAPKFQEPKSKQDEDSGGWWSRLISRIKSYVQSLPDSDSGVRTSAGKRPDVDLSGKADPKQNQEHKAKADTKIEGKKAEAQKETTKDFGEHDIYPNVKTTKLSSAAKIEGGPPREGKVGGEKPSLDADVRSALNTNLQPRMNEEVVPKNQEFVEAHQKYETDTAKEKEKGLKKIEAENARVKAEQEVQQDAAAKKVDNEREKWRQENENVKKTYEQQSADKKKEIDQKIDDKVQAAEKKADKKLKEAEQKSERERKKAERKARKKKQEAENKPRSFWDRVKGAVSDFFDKVRSAINTIFEGLRKLVKKIIEAAKKVVKDIIELARKAVVGLIKAFGEALKKFVSIALAAFPELAKKARAAIDKAVNKAVDAVNKAAQALKDFADKVLDAIGAALDFIITVFQKAYNAILDALEFIVVGLIEVMQGIANLVAAAKQSPDHFWNAIFQELTGTDPSKPLAAIERTEEPTPEKQAEGLAAIDAYTAKDEQLLKKEKLSNSDITIDPIQDISLSPELDMQIAQSDTDEIEFGGAGDDSMSVRELQSAMNPQSAGGGQSAPASEPAAGGGTGFGARTDEEKLQYYLDQMNPSCEDTAKDARGAGGGEEIPDVAKVGPLSVSQRMSYITKQLKKGLSNWWECNKITVISILVGVLLGGAILTVVTGGAFLAALPFILKALVVIFIAEMVYRMSGHLKDYLTKAWNGDISGGAKSLARALAVGAVELIFEGIFKVGGKLLKLMKNAGKRLAKSMGKIAKKVAKTTVKAVKTTGRAIKNVTVKGGRYTFKGLKKGFAKGTRTLDDLNKRLLARFKFRKFKLKRKGGRFQLLGYLNPWVLLANGDIEYSQGPKKDVVGKKMKVPDGREGIVIGTKGENIADASLITKYMRRNPKMAKEMSGLLTTLGDDALRAKAIRGITNYRYARGRYKDAIEVLTEVAKRDIKGLDKLLRDLAKGGNKAKGAGWVIRHLHKNKHLIKNLEEFEQFVRIGTKGDRRFYDAVIDGIKYEFKNWEQISDIFREGLVQQIFRDLRSGAKFKWIWSSSIGSKTALKNQIRDIITDKKLLQKFGYSPQNIKYLQKNIEKFFNNMEVL